MSDCLCICVGGGLAILVVLSKEEIERPLKLLKLKFSMNENSQMIRSCMGMFKKEKPNSSKNHVIFVLND